MLDIFKRFAADKVGHLIGGTIALAGLFLLYWLEQQSKPGAVALAGLMLGFGAEFYQLIRKEGQPDPEDAMTTAAPFILCAIALYALGVR